MRRIKPIIGILLIILSISGLLIWEKWGKDRLFYDEVLVLKKNVNEGTVITEDLLTTRKLNIDEDYIPSRERESILGKEAASFIHKGTPLFDEFFRLPVLSPSEEKGSYAFAIPQEWIMSVPESLSRGDRLFVFYGSKLLTSAYVVSSGEDEPVEIIVNREQAEQISGIASKGGRLVLAYQ